MTTSYYDVYEVITFEFYEICYMNFDGILENIENYFIPFGQHHSNKLSEE